MTIHYLNQWWPSSTTHICVTRPQWVKSWNNACSNMLYVSRIMLALLQGIYSLSGRTSYRKISWSLEAVRFGFRLFQSLWNLPGTTVAALQRCLSNCRAKRSLKHPISRLQEFRGSCGKTSVRLVNSGPGADARISGNNWVNDMADFPKPDHQTLLYWLRSTVSSLSFTRKDFNYKCHLSVENDKKRNENTFLCFLNQI